MHGLLPCQHIDLVYSSQVTMLGFTQSYPTVLLTGSHSFDVSSALGQSSKRAGEMSGTMEECNMTIQYTSAMHREWILQGAHQLLPQFG